MTLATRLVTTYRKTPTCKIEFLHLLWLKVENFLKFNFVEYVFFCSKFIPGVAHMIEGKKISLRLFYRYIRRNKRKFIISYEKKFVTKKLFGFLFFFGVTCIVRGPILLNIFVIFLYLSQASLFWDKAVILVLDNCLILFSLSHHNRMASVQRVTYDLRIYSNVYYTVVSASKF